MGRNSKHKPWMCPDQKRGVPCTGKGLCREGCIGGNDGQPAWGAPTREEAEAELAAKGLAGGRRMKAWEE
jgi:hypothetical protein